MRHPSPATREAIVQGTLRLLSSHEFSNVTTRDIARAASVSEATIFRHFQTKRDILDAILCELAKKSFGDIEEVLGLVDNPRDKLLALSRRHAVFAARNRDLILVVHKEASFLGESDSPCLDGLRKFLERIRQVLQEGIDRGIFRADLDLDAAVMAFHSAVPSVLLGERILLRKKYEEDAFLEQVERYCAFFLRAIQSEQDRT